VVSDRAEFQERLHASALSRWELGDLLGVHPHLLPEYGPGSLGHLPARLVVEVARHLDMHPADLVAGLDTVLHHPRLHNRPEPADTDAAADVDALTVLNALATATAPLTTDQVADVLAWTVERVTTTLARAANTPELAGPLALRQAAANTYTVTPRLDLLTGDERRRLHETARWNQPLDVEQANVLLAALVLHNNEYADQPGPPTPNGAKATSTPNASSASAACSTPTTNPRTLRSTPKCSTAFDAKRPRTQMDIELSARLTHTCPRLGHLAVHQHIVGVATSLSALVRHLAVSGIRHG
jgi:hypothetical protein